jgi:Pro-kumamolisin, activation domain/Subtilase family
MKRALLFPFIVRALPEFLTILVLAALSAQPSFAQGPPKDRIVQAIDNNTRTVIRGNVHPLARAEYDRGTVATTMPMRRVTMTFQLTSAQQADLSGLLVDQQNPASPSYHHWLTPDEFGSRFGLSQGDLNKVTAWLQAQGFQIVEVAHSRMWVAFSGTAGQVQAAFRTQIHNYAVNGKTHYANATAPSIPSALTGVVLGIRGLSDFRPKPHAIRRTIQPRYTSSVSGNTFIVPDDFATIYDLKPLYDAGIDGTGQKIAIMGQSDYVLNDIRTFRSLSGLPANDPQQILVSGDPGVVQGDVDEASLDIEWAGAVARNATIIFVNSNTGNGAFDSLTYAIDHNVAPVLAISYGDCEPDLGLSFVSSFATLTQEANAQGMTVVAPSGDSGATDCDNSLPATQGLAVDFPASSPYVTGVGGTELYGDLFNPGQYWSATNGSGNGSALSYIPETVWNDTQIEGAPDASGGGPSAFFSKPAWQTGTGVPDDMARDVPDISFSASDFHDPYLICSEDYGTGTAQPWCTTGTDGFRNTNNDSNNGFLDAFGGTSLGVPTFAGVVALINQETNLAQGNSDASGQSIGGQGNVNYVLYPLAANAPNAFHDIVPVTGGDNDNSIPCQQGTTNCPVGVTSIGFSDTVGYDLATGLGSLDIYNLVTEWPSISPTNGGCSTRGGCTSQDFQLSVSTPGLIISRGSSGETTVSVAAINGFSGTVDLSCSVSSNLTGTTCSVSPTSAAPGNSVMLTVTAQTQAGLGYPGRPDGIDWPWTMGLAIAGLCLLILASGAGAWRTGSAKAGRAPRCMAACLTLACLVVLAIGCGGNSSNSPPPPPPSTVPSNVTVQGTSGTTSHTVQLSVTLQ